MGRVQNRSGVLHPGYAQNRTDPSVEGTANDDDYSFKRDGDYTAITIVRSPNADDPNKPSGLPGREFGGKMEAGKTWVNFYCKDYAGASRLRATLHYSDGRPDEMLALSVPLDDDVGPNGTGDGIADKWEIAMGQRWSAQYGLPPLTVQEALAKFGPGEGVDIELADPDGAGALWAQAETGDAHTVLEEYRGYVLDGGGLDGAGANGHAGGHVRLDPARKEILIEVDRAAVVKNVPGAGNDVTAKLGAIMTGASGVFSEATRGAGIRMYWLMDEDALDLPENTVNNAPKVKTAFRNSRDTAADRPTQTPASLARDFMHLIFVDEGAIAAAATEAGGESVGALSIDYISATDDLKIRGTMIAVTDLFNYIAPGPNALKPAKLNEFIMTTVAHEITHFFFETPGAGGFDGLEHTTNANGNNVHGEAEDKTCLMYAGSLPENCEIGTVKFFPIVQRLLKIRTNQAFVGNINP